MLRQSVQAFKQIHPIQTAGNDARAAQHPVEHGDGRANMIAHDFRSFLGIGENILQRIRSMRFSGRRKIVRATALAIIAANTAESSGIGRVSIQRELEKQGLYLSDDKLRKLLKRLESEGKITTGRGRTGCRIV